MSASSAPKPTAAPTSPSPQPSGPAAGPSSSSADRKQGPAGPAQNPAPQTQPSPSAGRVSSPPAPSASGLSRASSQSSLGAEPSKEKERLLEGAQTPETIIFAVDLHEEMKGYEFNEQWPKLTLVKDALRVFVQSKIAMSERHTFGLCALRTSATWVCPLAESREQLLSAIARLVPEDDYRSCNLDSLFELVEPVCQSRPNGTVRVVMIYGRSSVMPTWTGCDAREQKSAEQSRVARVLSRPNFFLDALYLHKPGVAACQAVYDRITSLDDPDHSGYFFEQSTKAASLFRSMAFFLAHPEQRANQQQQQQLSIVL